MYFERIHGKTCTLCRDTDTCALDTKTGALVCIGCGCVVDEHYDWPVNSYRTPSYAQYRRFQARNYIPYNRLYHFNERLAQRNAVDPRVPRKLILDLGSHFAKLGMDPARLDSVDICRELRKRDQKKYCERWTQIKYRMTCEDPSDRDDDGMPEPHIKPADRQVSDFPQFWPHKWLSEDALFSFRFYFTRVSQAFDKRYFKAGKRITTKCNLYNNSATKLARHNLVSSRQSRPNADGLRLV